MPLQNRVTPAGDIVATPHRGLLTGNRGIIHDPQTRTLLKRRWTTKAWIACVCEFRGRRREVMAGRSWTELFFLDEATALAAGHRPCFFCRRGDANRFRAAWEKGNGVARVLRTRDGRGAAPGAACERQEAAASRFRCRSRSCPTARWSRTARRVIWSCAAAPCNGASAGYRPARYRDSPNAMLLTPPSTLAGAVGGISADAASERREVTVENHARAPFRP